MIIALAAGQIIYLVTVKMMNRSHQMGRPKCGSCKYFRRTKSYAGLCLSGKVGTHQSHHLDVVALRASGQVSLTVGQDFGCIHWIKKGTEDVEREQETTESLRVDVPSDLA